MADESKNVRGSPLKFWSKGVGFARDGFCRTVEGDERHLSVAVVMSHAFHQSEYGDDDYKGISAGQKTCISAYDFREAIKEMGPDMLPVSLSSTHDKALEVVTLEDLKKYAYKEK